MAGRVVACVRNQWAGFLALFLVIAGGTAYAANTVGSSDIIDGEVKTADLATNSVRTTKIATGQVQSVDIANRGIQEDDLAHNSVGPDELQAGTVPHHTYNDSGGSANDTTKVKEVEVSCALPEHKVVSGGYVISGPGGANVPEVEIQRSYAVNDNTWLVRAMATSGAPQWQLAVVTTCAF